MRACVHVNPNRKLQSPALRAAPGFVVRLPGQQSMSMQVQACAARYKLSFGVPLGS